MRKTTLIHYDNMDVQRIVRDELEKAGLDKVPAKLDKLMVTVDGIAGAIKDYREEQELNANKLSEHTDQLEKHENILKKLVNSVA